MGNGIKDLKLYFTQIPMVDLRVAWIPASGITKQTL